MKKTTSISIHNTLFHIEDDAYHTLDSYLTSIQSHFANNPDKEEILNDIEERIAEKFVESGANVISENDVKKVIDAMGTVEQITDTKEEPVQGERVESKTSQPKKLYRDTEDVIVAGICSGLGAYLSIDTRVIRVIFLVTIFFGGAGIIVYLILWIIIPKATTAAQKMAMRGDPITLSSISKSVKEKVGKMRGTKE